MTFSSVKKLHFCKTYESVRQTVDVTEHSEKERELGVLVVTWVLVGLGLEGVYNDEVASMQPGLSSFPISLYKNRTKVS